MPSADGTANPATAALRRELRALVNRGLTGEQIRRHYVLNDAPQPLIDLVQCELAALNVPPTRPTPRPLLARLRAFSESWQ